MSSLVRMICPNLSCRKVLSVPQSARGKSVRCRHCGMRIQVPVPAAPEAPAPGTPGTVADPAAAPPVKKAG